MKIPEQNEKLRKYQEAYLQHIYLLQRVTEFEPNIKDPLKMLFLFYSTRIIESSDTLLLLSVKNKLNDSYAISRMILETATNIVYISTKPEDLIDKSLEYAHQKMFRDLDRSLKIGSLNLSIKFSGIDDIIKSDKLDNAIKKFTNPDTNEEIRDWTGVDKKTIMQKIEKITENLGEHIGIVFLTAMYVVYRYSSEILHGTTFGAMYSLGLTQIKHERSKTPENIKKYQEDELKNILYSFNLLLNAVIRIYLQKFPNEEFESERQQLSENIEEIDKNSS